MKFDNYYLDLKKVNSLKSKNKREQISRYYTDMIHSFYDGRNSIGISLFNTLYTAEYLKELRSEKIDKIIPKS
jgi:hypothetical protein